MRGTIRGIATSIDQDETVQRAILYSPNICSGLDNRSREERNATSLFLFGIDERRKKEKQNDTEAAERNASV